MESAADPFSHHLELRDRIADPLTSPSRTLTTAKLATLAKTRGLPADWWYVDSAREAERAATLTGRWDADLWVFGYGSLMWDPGVRFEEVRRAHVPGHTRRFILKDIYGGRGTVDAPGLMVALDKGAGATGLRSGFLAQTSMRKRRSCGGAKESAPPICPCSSKPSQRTLA
jgi:glutathione-specific gamma-glutamylcyclotransferase